MLNATHSWNATFLTGAPRAVFAALLRFGVDPLWPAAPEERQITRVWQRDSRRSWPMAHAGWVAGYFGAVPSAWRDPKPIAASGRLPGKRPGPFLVSGAPAIREASSRAATSAIVSVPMTRRAELLASRSCGWLTNASEVRLPSRIKRRCFVCFVSDRSETRGRVPRSRLVKKRYPVSCACRFASRRSHGSHRRADGGATMSASQESLNAFWPTKMVNR